MIAFEVALIFLSAIVGVVLITAIGRPLAQAYAEKIKTHYRAIGSQEACDLKERLHSVEGELIDLRSQVKILQENNEYVTKLLELKEHK